MNTPVKCHVCSQGPGKYMEGPCGCDDGILYQCDVCWNTEAHPVERCGRCGNEDDDLLMERLGSEAADGNTEAEAEIWYRENVLPPMVIMKPADKKHMNDMIRAYVAGFNSAKK
jgi:hypothetical protein